jgi:predicted ArsR family transcriptional regulator
MPVARAADRLGVSENTARKALRELLQHGFIEVANDAHWINGKARSYRLTIRPNHKQEPTDLWRHWSEDHPVIPAHPKKTEKPFKN